MRGQINKKKHRVAQPTEVFQDETPTSQHACICTHVKNMKKTCQEKFSYFLHAYASLGKMQKLRKKANNHNYKQGQASTKNRETYLCIIYFYLNIIVQKVVDFIKINIPFHFVVILANKFSTTVFILCVLPLGSLGTSSASNVRLSTCIATFLNCQTLTSTPLFLTLGGNIKEFKRLGSIERSECLSTPNPASKTSRSYFLGIGALAAAKVMVSIQPQCNRSEEQGK